MLLDAYFKIAGYIIMKGNNASDSEIQTYNDIVTVFDTYADNINVELQKRSFEYKLVLES